MKRLIVVAASALLLATAGANAQQAFSTSQSKNGDDSLMTLKKLLNVEHPLASGVIPSKSDTVDLAKPSKAIYIGGAGDLKVDFVSNGTGVTMTALAAGILLPIAVKRIYTTGTTATLLIEFY